MQVVSLCLLLDFPLPKAYFSMPYFNAICLLLSSFFFVVSYVEKGHGGLLKAPTEEESERLRGERGQIKLIDLRFKRWQVVGLSELC